MKEKNNKEIVYLLVCLVVVTLIYLLNHFTLYTSDDFVYRFIYKEPFPSDNEQPVRSLFDLITSQMNHWKVWNGLLDILSFRYLCNIIRKFSMYLIPLYFCHWEY